MILYLRNSAGYRSLTGPRRASGSHAVEAPAYTAAIVYLLSVMPGPRMPEEIFDSLSLMHMNIPWRHQWPVLLLHAGAYDAAESQAEFIARLRATAAVHGMATDMVQTLIDRLEFVPTEHPLPDGVPETGRSDGPVWSQEWPGAFPALISRARCTYRTFMRQRTTTCALSTPTKSSPTRA